MTRVPPGKTGLTVIILMITAIAAGAYIIIVPFTGGIIVENTRFMMGTAVQIKIALRGDLKRAHAEAAIDKAFAEVSRVEGVFSVYRKDSEISRINAIKAREEMALSEEVFGLIEKSVVYNKKTGGAFDITVKPLVDLWARVKSDGRLPSKEEIDAARGRVGSQYLALDRRKRTISFEKDGMALDLAGVAKGYAVDRAVAVLRSESVKNAIVNAGGDAYCLGSKSRWEEWKIGVRHPRKADALIIEMPLSNRAIDTSGDYERFFTLGDRRYSHIIDPRSGYPVGDDTVSATVLAGDSATADMLATALSVLGQAGMKIIEADTRLDAIIIRMKDGRLDIITSKGLRDYEKLESGL